jgi:DNA-binding transcriptional MocR family regulator
MNVALHLPLRLPDRDVVAEAAGEGLRLLPLSRYAVVARRANGLLLGYTALSERQIGAGIARLARVLVRLGGAGRRPELPVCS